MRLIFAISFALSSLSIANAVGASPSHVPAPKGNFIAKAPKAVREMWLCILWNESRSTLRALNLMDNNRYGSSGIFQIEQGTWQAHQLNAHVPYRVHVWQASVSQQFAVARSIWLSDGFNPWRGDGCL